MSDTSLGDLVLRLRADASEYTEAFRQAEESTVESMSHMVESVELGAVAIVGALTAIAVAGVEQFAKLESAVTVSTATMAGATDAMRQQMEDQAISLSENSANSAEAIGQAYGALSKAGLNAQQSLRAIAVADQFAQGAHEDMTRATLALAKAQETLGMQTTNVADNTKNLAELSDIFTQSAVVSGASAVDMAEGVAQAGKYIKDMNGGLNEAVAVMSAFVKQGMSAQEAGSQLSRMLQIIQMDAVRNAGAWNAWGITVNDASGKMLPLVTIAQELGTATKGMDDETRQAMMTSLGFQARTATLMKSLEAMGDTVGGVQQQMAGYEGATGRAVDRQQDFEEDLTKLTHQLQAILITIGQQLVPVILEWAQDLGIIDQKHQVVTATISNLARTISDVLLTAIDVMRQSWYWLNVVILQGQHAILVISQYIVGMATIIYDDGVMAFDELAKVAVAALNPIIHLINDITQGLDRMTGTLHKTPLIPELDASAVAGDIKQRQAEIASFYNDTDAYGKAAIETQNELTALLAQGAPEIANDMNKTTQSTKTATAAWQSWAHSMGLIPPAAAATATAVQAVSDTTQQLKGDFESIMLEKSPFVKALEELKNVDAEAKTYHASLEQIDQAERDIVSKASPFISDHAGMNAKDSSSGSALADQMQANREKLADLDKTHAQEIRNLQLTDAQLLEIDKNYQNQRNQLVTAQNLLTLTAAEDTATSLMTISQTLFGKQSTEYEAAFVAQKAFALATAAINVETAISAAWSDPALSTAQRLADVATAISGTATIVSDIASIRMSFLGGGYTGDGSRSGGVDGSGGFMAVLHPNEQVTDLEQGQTTPGGGMALNVTINNTMSDTAQVTATPGTDGKSLNIIVQAVDRALASNIVNRQGLTTRALEATYSSLGRGQAVRL